MLAGIAGALTQTLRQLRRPVTSATAYTVEGTVALGAGAGLVSALLFAASQWATAPSLAEELNLRFRLIAIFAMIVAYIAGLTLEAVFSKLERIDVVNVEPIDPSKKAAPQRMPR